MNEIEITLDELITEIEKLSGSEIYESGCQNAVEVIRENYNALEAGIIKSRMPLTVGCKAIIRSDTTQMAGIITRWDIDFPRECYPGTLTLDIEAMK